MGNRVKISPNFYLDEFACTCGCGLTNPQMSLVWVLEAIRLNFGGRPVAISGPLRCHKKNGTVPGAAADSRHLPEYRDGVDVRVKGVPASTVADFAESFLGDFGGVGRYPNRTHVDTRGSKARWKG